MRIIFPFMPESQCTSEKEGASCPQTPHASCGVALPCLILNASLAENARAPSVEGANGLGVAANHTARTAVRRTLLQDRLEEVLDDLELDLRHLGHGERVCVGRVGDLDVAEGSLDAAGLGGLAGGEGA